MDRFFHTCIYMPLHLTVVFITALISYTCQGLHAILAEIGRAMRDAFEQDVENAYQPTTVRGRLWLSGLLIFFSSAALIVIGCYTGWVRYGDRMETAQAATWYLCWLLGTLWWFGTVLCMSSRWVYDIRPTRPYTPPINMAEAETRHYPLEA